MTPDGPPVAAGVVCHAHPLHGGVMHFKVVFRAAKALRQHGVAALRFNFRGMGRRFPGLPLVLGGFSFGAQMALRVGCTETGVRALFALGLPVMMMTDLSFLAA